MKQNWKVFALTAALAAALCGATALAADLGEDVQAEPTAGQERTQVENQEAQGLETDAQTKETGSESEETDVAPEELVPDPVGTGSFANLDSRLRENNLNLLALEENIAALEVIDYDKMREQMVESLNEIAKQIDNISSMGDSLAQIPIYNFTDEDMLIIDMVSTSSGMSLKQTFTLSQ